MSSQGTGNSSQSDTSAYDELLERLELINNLGQAMGILGWDQRVVMPEEGAPARSLQMSTLSSIMHEKFTDDRIGELLEEIDEGKLDDEQQAVVREVREGYERKKKVPTELNSEMMRMSSEAQEVWKSARSNSDFEEFAPILGEILELQREKTNHIDPDRPTYEVLFDDFERYIDLETVERIFDRLLDELVPLIEDIRESDVEIEPVFEKGAPYPQDEQEELMRDALDTLGYDWIHGRLDTAPHPFHSGNPYDARVTTRYNEENPIKALLATVHEFGHATYTLGLPKEHHGTPLGSSRSPGVHESQSRFWENHIGRSREFWEHFLPKVKERFPSLEEVSVDEAYKAVNRVYDDNVIRVEADELTYHMHIILRHEIEREFVEEEDISGIPQAWNNKMDEYLGIRPENDAEGCLQDTHWAGGFSGFESYTIGSVLAAQLYAAAEEDIRNLDEKIARGDFTELHDWLTDNVHSHGQRYKTQDLIKEATGEELKPDYFIDYVNEKYSKIYDL